MESINNKYLKKHKKFRSDYKKLALAFFVLAVLVALVVFWWLKLVGVTISGDAFCGATEHLHDESCYVSELICDIEETDVTTTEEEKTTTTTEEETTTTEEEETTTTEEETTTTEEKTTTSEEETTTTEEEETTTTEEETTTTEEETTTTEEETTTTEEETTTTEEEVTSTTKKTTTTTEESTTKKKKTTTTVEETTTKKTTTTTAPAHVHTDGCYRQVLVCKMAEHTHTQDCYPDKSADVETVSDWLATIETVEITNSVPKNLISIARSQLGYAESKDNFEFDDNGNKNGYTRYGEWYGNPYAPWDATFVSFCLHFSNVNNGEMLKSAGAESLRLAWQDRGVYSSAEEHEVQRGDVVFLDTDHNGIADSVAIVVSTTEDSLLVIAGDSDDQVEQKSIALSEDILGYGCTSDLSYAKDMNYQTETTKPKKNMLMIQAPLMSTDTSKSNIIYISDLAGELEKITFLRHDGTEVDEDDTIHLGEPYTIILQFTEINTKDPWVQFKYDENGFLTYQIPDKLHCEPFTEWQPIEEAKNGTTKTVGEYWVDENGLLKVRFFDENNVNYIDKYSNLQFQVEFGASVTVTTPGSTEITFGDNIKVELNIDGGAEMEIEKQAGVYDIDTQTVDWTVEVKATHGVVHDFYLVDNIDKNHQYLDGSLFVTDLDGNPLDPQPTVAELLSPDFPYSFKVEGFPDFPAGTGYLITYKTKLLDGVLEDNEVSAWNGVVGYGKDSNDKPVEDYSENYVTVQPEKMNKTGKQDILVEGDTNIPVIEWTVEIQNFYTDLQGTIIVDTLGEGQAYYTGRPIKVRCWDEQGNVTDLEISWDDVVMEGNNIHFPLPEGYEFLITYYTTYEDLDDGDKGFYTNTASATINGKDETTTGTVTVIGFRAEVHKSAYGNDGEYVYFTIETLVPDFVKDQGHFYLYDEQSSWGQASGYWYVENQPLDMEIIAVTESGETITFTPHVPGGPEENTFILVSPAVMANGAIKQYAFEIYFNTAEANAATSKWLLDENANLIIKYKIPFDAKLGSEYTGTLTGDKTLGDVLDEGSKLTNWATMHYREDIIAGTSAEYEFSPKIFKKAKTNSDGTIDYTVDFITDNGYGGFFLTRDTTSAYFLDTFDEKLEYVPGSLVVTCSTPWNYDVWLMRYAYTGDIEGNEINLHANQFSYVEMNQDVGWYELTTFRDLETYYKNHYGGLYTFTYKLKLKDEYYNTTDFTTFMLDNTAEVKWDEAGTTGPITTTTEYKTGLISKEAVQKNNKLDFAIDFNSMALDVLTGADTVDVGDAMSQNLSVYWDSIQLHYEDENGNWINFADPNSQYQYTVLYDQYTNKLTFTVPDELHIKINYTTLVTESGSVAIHNTVSVHGKTHVTDFVDAVFKVETHSGSASGSVHNITLLKHDGETGAPLPGVTLHLYGPVGDLNAPVPDGHQQIIVTETGKKLYYIASYTTGEDGTHAIESQYLTEGGPYALVEDAPPPGYLALTKPAYFYFYEDDPNGIIPTVTTIITVENFSHAFALPETGGTGTIPFGIIGMALMAAPIVYSILRRKRERRLS